MSRLLLAVLLLFASISSARAGDPPGLPLQLEMFNGSSKGACLQTTAFAYQQMAMQCLAAGGAQMYMFQAVSGGGHRIVNVQTGKCMDVQWGATNAGARILDWPCNGQDNQRWEVDYASGAPGIAMIRGWQSKLCLDLADDGLAVQSPCDFGKFNGPIWFAARQYHRDAGNAQALRAVSSGLCMGTDMWPVMLACNSNSLVKFSSLDTAGTTFQIRGGSSCLVDHQGIVYFAMCPTTTDASWRLVEHAWGPAHFPRQTRWQIQNVATGRCLNVDGANNAAGTAVIAWPCEGTDNMVWTING